MVVFLPKGHTLSMLSAANCHLGNKLFIYFPSGARALACTPVLPPIMQCRIQVSWIFLYSSFILCSPMQMLTLVLVGQVTRAVSPRLLLNYKPNLLWVKGDVYLMVVTKILADLNGRERTQTAVFIKRIANRLLTITPPESMLLLSHQLHAIGPESQSALQPIKLTSIIKTTFIFLLIYYNYFNLPAYTALCSRTNYTLCLW